MSQLPGLLTLSGVLYGTISAPAPLTGSIVAKASLTATLSTPAGLYGSISSQGQLTGTMIANEPLSGVIVSRGQLVGHISGTIKGTETETYMLVYEDGTEVPAVFVEDEVTFTATPNDIRLGSVAATGEGVTVGAKVIPSYHTTQTIRIVKPGMLFTIPLSHLDLYAYTKLQAIICPFNSSLSDSVSAEKITLDDAVYPVLSTECISVVTKDATAKAIDLGIVNDTDSIYLIRYFTYKEIY